MPPLFVAGWPPLCRFWVFSCFSASRPCLQTLGKCIYRISFFPALPSGQQRAPPQRLRHQREKANPLLWIRALGKAQAHESVCVT